MPEQEQKRDGGGRTDAGYARIGWAIWVVFLAALIAKLLTKPPGDRSVTPEYHRAALEWWHSHPIYTEGVHGFLYLPQAAIVYSPFALLGGYAEEILWRVLGIGLLATGLFRLIRTVLSQQSGFSFMVASGLAVISSLGSAANGQTNVHMAGLFAWCCADLIGRRWWRVGAWLLLALACKPTALVMILLVAAVYLRPMGWRLALLLIAFLAVPFIHPDVGYVLEQHRGCLAKLATASEPGDAFADVRGMLMEFGLVRVEPTVLPSGEPGWTQTPPTIVLTAIRAAAALGTLGMCLLASRRLGERGRAMVLYTLGAVYLTLFNPRTEGLSYILLGAPATVWALRELRDRRWWSAAFFLVFVLSTQFSTQMALGTKNYWMRPLGAALIGLFVAGETVRGRSRWDSDASSQARV